MVSISVRAWLAGVGYVLALFVVGALFSAVGIQLGSASAGAALLPWLFLAGVLIALTLGPLASSLAASRRQQLVVWSFAIFFNHISTLIEGAFFAPELIRANGVALASQQLLLDVVTAALIVWLFAPARPRAVAAAPVRRSRPQWAWRFGVSALSYLAFYFIFGALNYALVTRPYYESHAGGITVPAPQAVLVAEAVRAPLIVLAILPLILLAAQPRRELAVQCGLILFVVGGIVPLLLQVNTLPMFLLVASAVEIFCQNFLTGMVSAILLGRPSEHRTFTSPQAMATAP